MTSELTKALCAFHLSVDKIHKSAKAQYGAFADLATVLSAVIPALAKNGLCCTQTFEPAAERDEPILITTLSHTSGETIESRLPMIIGKGRNALHDFGGSVTYLRRYALLAIVGLAADVDTDGDLGSTPTETKPQSSPSPKPKAAKKQEAPKPALDDNPTPEDVAPGEPFEPGSLPLDNDQRTLLLTLIKESSDMQAVITAFRKEFGLADDAKISNEITTEQHAAFLRAQLSN